MTDCDTLLGPFKRSPYDNTIYKHAICKLCPPLRKVICMDMIQSCNVVGIADQYQSSSLTRNERFKSACSSQHYLHNNRTPSSPHASIPYTVNEPSPYFQNTVIRQMMTIIWPRRGQTRNSCSDLSGAPLVCAHPVYDTEAFSALFSFGENSCPCMHIQCLEEAGTWSTKLLLCDRQYDVF